MSAYPAYPSAAAPDPGPPAEPLPQLDMPPALHQNRFTVLLRLLILIPQFVVVWALSIAATVVTVIGWFAALVLGRLPDGFHRFLSHYLAYEVRVWASSMLLTDRYPPFRWTNTEDYPVRIEVQQTALNRLAVLFRIILAIPAAIVEYVLNAGWWAFSFITWVIALVLGRMPQPLYEASTAALRYQMRLQAYLMMLTPCYPKRLFGDGTELPGREPISGSATRPLLMGTGGKAMLIVFLVLGVLSAVGGSTTRATYSGNEVNATAPADGGR